MDCSKTGHAYEAFTYLFGWNQGRIYVANEDPTIARNMAIVSRKLQISDQIILDRGQICLFWWKTSKYKVKIHKFFSYSAPYCRESKILHPTSRAVGAPKYAPGWNISIHLLSANKNSPVDLVKLAITGNFGLIRDFGTRTTHFTSKCFILGYI